MEHALHLLLLLVVTRLFGELSERANDLTVAIKTVLAKFST